MIHFFYRTISFHVLCVSIRWAPSDEILKTTSVKSLFVTSCIKASRHFSLLENENDIHYLKFPYGNLKTFKTDRRANILLRTLLLFKLKSKFCVINLVFYSSYSSHPPVAATSFLTGWSGGSCSIPFVRLLCIYDGQRVLILILWLAVSFPNLAWDKSNKKIKFMQWKV